MKMVGVRDAKQDLSGYVDKAQHEGIIITKHGKPAAVIVGVDGYDLEDVMTMADPSFWKMIERRRREPTVPLEEVKRQLLGPTHRRRRRAK